MKGQALYALGVRYLRNGGKGRFFVDFEGPPNSIPAMRLRISPLVVLAAVLMGPGIQSGTAAVLSFSGTFSAPMTGPITTLSGSFQFDFDDSVVTGAVSEFFDGIPLNSFSLSPSMIGSTTFDLSNSVGAVRYESGILTEFAVGGAAAGGVRGIDPNTEDFAVLWANIGGVFSGPPVGQFYILPGQGQLFNSEPASGTVTVVPEPSSTLLLLGGTGLVFLRRRRLTVGSPSHR